MNNAQREEVFKDTVEGEKDTSEEIKLQEKEQQQQQHKTGNNERKESRRVDMMGGTRVQRIEQGCRRRREKREQ